MKYLKIQNNGELDIRLVALMGGTTKTNDKYKIGQFGTGLKYTLSYLFRNNIEFKVFVGEKLIDIKTEKETIKDTDFEIVCLEGHRTSITTQMGHQWNAWMIIRELWCNALDEGGSLREVITDDELVIGEAEKTTFYIQLTTEIQQVLDNWSSYFIHNKEPMWENDDYAIYENSEKGNLKLYKQGVLIYQHPHTKSLFNYDIKGADINELREFRGLVSYEVFNALEKPNETVITYFLQNVGKEKDYYEATELDYDWYKSFGAIWKEVIGNQKVAKTGSGSYYSERGIDVDFSNVIELPKKVYSALVKQFEGIGALTMTDDKVEFFEIPNAHFQAKIKDCIALLETNGYFISSEMIISYGVFEDTKKPFAINERKKHLMISEICQNMSPLELINILVENNEFITTKHPKHSTDFFQHFIKLYTQKLITKNSLIEK